MEKYTIIGGDIHKLVKIKKDKDWSEHAWLIHFRDSYYWAPIPDCNDDSTKKRWQLINIDPDKCALCRKRKF